MNLVGIKFMLEGGQFVAVKATYAEFQRAVAAWKAEAPIIEGKCLGTGVEWLLRPKSIIAMHQFNWDEAVGTVGQTRPQTLPPLWGAGKSGQA